MFTTCSGTGGIAMGFGSYAEPYNEYVALFRGMPLTMYGVREIYKLGLQMELETYNPQNKIKLLQQELHQKLSQYNEVDSKEKEAKKKKREKLDNLIAHYYKKNG